MSKSKTRGVSDNLLLQTYFESNARVGETFKALRLMGHKFRDSTTRVQLKDVLTNHIENVDKMEAGTLEPTTAVGFRDGNYFITSAQNNTKVHQGMFDTMLNFCKVNDAKLLVSKFTYKKKGFQTATSESDNLWYDPCLAPYLMNEQIQLGDFLFYGNFDILPTAVNPLSGLESHSGEKDCGFPHTKLNMRPVASLPTTKAKHIYTTGACTLINYVPRKAGQKAELHHVFGGLFVEVRNGIATVTPVSADDTTGTFHVFDTYYTPKTSKRENVFAVNFGDIHLEKLDDEYYGKIMDVMDTLKPEHVFLHDVLDFEARNHHEKDNKFARYAKHVTDRESVLYNVTSLLDWLNKLSKKYPDTTLHIVPSNHNDAFYKWANSDQPSNDYVNLEFWHLVNYTMLKHIRKHNDDEAELLPIMADVLNIEMNKNVVFHTRSESVRYYEIEYNLHGDLGANGVRGNPTTFARLGFKANTGHTHSAGIYNGVYVAGVSGTLEHGYNVGLSSWSNAYIITYKRGKRTIITQYS